MPPMRTSASIVKRNTHVKSPLISPVSELKRLLSSPEVFASKNPTSIAISREKSRTLRSERIDEQAQHAFSGINEPMNR